MTENEAKKLVESMQIAKDCEMVKTLELLAVIIKALEDVQPYRAIGTVEEFKELKEKNEPKKPDYEGDGYADGKLVYDYAKCPVCGHGFEYGINDWEAEYCSDCGQKLDRE